MCSLKECEGFAAVVRDADEESRGAELFGEDFLVDGVVFND